MESVAVRVKVDRKATLNSHMNPITTLACPLVNKRGVEMSDALK